MAATKLKSWKDINDEIRYILFRNSNGLINSELTTPPLIKSIKVNNFEDFSKEEATNFAIEYFKKWIYVLNDKEILGKNEELAKDIRKVYNSNFGCYFAVINDIDYMNIFLLQLDYNNIEKTIEKVRENFGAGPTELELLFTSKENQKDVYQRLNTIMRKQINEIKEKHKDFLASQRVALYTYIENIIENVISKYK